MSLTRITLANRLLKTDLLGGKHAKVSDVNPIIDQVNLNSERNTLYPIVVAAMIVATSTSTTTNFGVLAVGDKVLVTPVADSPAVDTTGSYFLTVVTTGTLPAAAVVGNLYTVLRSV